MTQALLLTTPQGVAPRTEDGNWGVVMLTRSGCDKTHQWFDFKPEFYKPPVRAVWPVGTMLAAVPAEIAQPIVERGYARIMTLDEAKEFNAHAMRPKPPEAPLPPPKDALPKDYEVPQTGGSDEHACEPKAEDHSLQPPAGGTIRSAQGDAREPEPRPDAAGSSGSHPEDVDTSDIPEASEEFFKRAKLVEPAKPVTRRRRLADKGDA